MDLKVSSTYTGQVYYSLPGESDRERLKRLRGGGEEGKAEMTNGELEKKTLVAASLNKHDSGGRGERERTGVLACHQDSLLINKSFWKSLFGNSVAERSGPRELRERGARGLMNSIFRRD